VVITEIASSSVPASPASIAGLLTICEGSVNTYMAATSAGATSYNWTVPAGYSIISGQGTATVTIMAGTSSGTIDVTASSACGASAPTSLALTVNARPVVTATAASGVICDGSSDQLDASGAVSYSWSSGGTNATEMVTPSSTSSYSVIGTDGNGCSDTAYVTVTVNPLPAVTASASGAMVCEGTADTLYAGGAMTYSWSSGGTNATEFVTPTATTTYTVTGADMNGCSASASVTVTVNTLPNVTASSAGDVCEGGSTILTGSGAINYQWSSGGNASTEIVTPVSSSSYTVTGTDANGCENTATVAVAVNPNPVVNLGADTAACGSVTPDAMNAGSSYAWSNSSTSQAISVVTSGTYYVTVTNGAGCSASDTIAVTVNPYPTVTASAASDTLCTTDASMMLSGAPAGGTWTGPGISGTMFSPATAGTGSHTLTYTYMSPQGCEGSAAVVVFVSPCTGIAEEGNGGGISISPNPSSGQFVFTALQNGTVEVFNSLGQTVFSGMVYAGNNTLAVQTADNGVYFVRFIDEQRNVHLSKMVIRK
jgi:hypothetical protein